MSADPYDLGRFLEAQQHCFGLSGLGEALAKYYRGEPDPRTLELLISSAS